MHAPLARHLARFSPPPAGASAAPLPVAIEPPEAEPTITMTVAVFEARVEAVRAGLQADLDAERAVEVAAMETAHAEALASAVAAAAAQRDAAEATAIAAAIAAAVESARDTLRGEIAAALRPLFAEAVAARALAQLVDVVERVLADPDHPALTIRGPAARLAAIERALARDGVTYVVSETEEIGVTGATIRVGTRLAPALAVLSESA